MLILLIFCICFIWGHSTIAKEESYAESGFFLSLIKPLIEKVYDSAISNHAIRKIAHFTEYAVFSVVLSYMTYWIEIKWKPLFVLGIGVIVAVLDETIQIFSGCNSQVRDVLIDLTGVAAAYTMVAVGTRIKKKVASQ